MTSWSPNAPSGIASDGHARGLRRTACALAAAIWVAASGAALADGSAQPTASTSAARPPRAAATASPGTVTPARPLDLSAPPINHIFTRGEVQTLTANHDSEPVESEDVMVKGTQYQAPVPVGQLRAIPWALMHPLEAWRIFTPITSP